MGCTISKKSREESKSKKNLEGFNQDFLNYRQTKPDQVLITPELEQEALNSEKNSNLFCLLSNPQKTQESIRKDTENNELPHNMSTFLTETLQNSIIFSCFSQSSLKRLIQKMQQRTFQKNQKIFIEKHQNSSFFVIQSGAIKLFSGLNEIILNSVGDSFGLLGLITKSFENYSACAVTDCSIWELSKDDFLNNISNVSNGKILKKFEILQNIQIFSKADLIRKDLFLCSLKILKCNQFAKVIRENQTLSLFYIIGKGTVQISCDGLHLRYLSQGEYFGEQSIFRNAKTTATVKAATKLVLLTLTPEKLFSLTTPEIEKYFHKNTIRISLKKSKVFRQLSDLHLERILNSISIVSMKIDENFKKFDKESVFFVLRGEILSVFGSFKIYSCIGDENFLRKKALNDLDNIRILADAEIGVISFKNIEKCLGKSIKNAINHNNLCKTLKRITFFRHLSGQIIEKLADQSLLKKYKKNETIFKEGTVNRNIFIVKKGRVKLYKGLKLAKQILKNGCFGESSVLKKSSNFSTVSKGASCWVLETSDFQELLTEKVKEQIEKEYHFYNRHVELQDLALQHFIGQGSFGSVFLAENKHNQELFALKSVHFSTILHFDMVSNIKHEKRVLLSCDHPFILKLFNTYKDRNRVFFLSEFIKGQDLFDLSLKDNFSIKSVKFYMSCLILILEYLHERGIIYRDLKPENIMIGADGYPKLIDFGMAKIIKKHKTCSILGTPHYMAPEVILGQQYSFSADIWSLGIILFKMIYKKLPFANDSHNPIEIYREICDSTLKFPETCKGNVSQRLIFNLLDKRQSKRPDINFVKNQIWFSDQDFDLIYIKKIQPPYFPKIEPVIKKKKHFYQNFELFISKYETVFKDFLIQKIDHVPNFDDF